MKIVIEELNTGNLDDVNRCNNEFVIDSKLVLHLENDVLSYTIMPVAVARKRYAMDSVDYSAYIGHPDRVVYLAYLEGQIAGQVILRRNWNGYAYIEDISVDARCRRQGLGKELMARAVGWAKERHLPGIMLETQDNNVAACRFYEKCGFQLRGFDTFLYKGIDGSTDEIALYWYLMLEEKSID